MDLNKRIEELERLHRLDMIRKCLNSILAYVDDSFDAIDDETECTDDMEIVTSEISGKIIKRVKEDLSILNDKYL